MTIKAIETRYAGCHFRSRLEARWAVFFDHLGIQWEYEPQGFELTYRLDPELEGETFNYLPDFYLPVPGQYVEVKGRWRRNDVRHVLNACALLGDIVIAGPLDNASNMFGWRPWITTFHKGDVFARPWQTTNWDAIWIAADWGQSEFEYAEIGELLLPGMVLGRAYRGLNGRDLIRSQAPSRLDRVSMLLEEAIGVARSARFEHGQSGAT